MYSKIQPCEQPVCSPPRTFVLLFLSIPTTVHGSEFRVEQGFRNLEFNSSPNVKRVPAENILGKRPLTDIADTDDQFKCFIVMEVVWGTCLVNLGV